MKSVVVLLVCFFVSSTVAIFNGTTASEGEFPFVVQLYMQATIRGPPNFVNVTAPFFCGGSIITSNIILTAAHCVGGMDGLIHPDLELTVKAGTISNIKEQETVGTQTRAVKNILIHPKYKNNFHPLDFNDMAILVLETPLTFNEFVSPIKIPVVGQVFDGNAEACGWGLNDYTNGTSSTLLKAQFRILSRSACIMKMAMSWWDVNSSKTLGSKETLESEVEDLLEERLGGEVKEICTAGHNTASIGRGDSGGPLICYFGPKKEPLLCGIASLMTFPILNGKPEVSIFTAVANSADWINARLSEYSQGPERREQQIAQGISIIITGLAILLCTMLVCMCISSICWIKKAQAGKKGMLEEDCNL